MDIGSTALYGAKIELNTPIFKSLNVRGYAFFLQFPVNLILQIGDAGMIVEFEPVDFFFFL